MRRARRLPRHLLTGAPGATAARAPRAAAISGPVALAWLDAVEAPLAPAVRTIVRRRLARAQTRRVTFAAGSVLAEIRQPSYRSHIATIRVPIAGEAVWEALLGAAAHHARWLASLAVGDLGDEDLAAALVDAGLVPPGLELSAQCTCRSEVRLCVHAALAAHVAARVLTAEPARMLVVRGITLDRIRGRIADRLPGPAGTDAVDPAAIDWDALVTADVAPFPPPPRPPLAPGRAVPAPEPPPSAGFGADDVVALAEDAAARALEVLVDGGEGALDLDVDADLARRVAQLPPGGVLALADAVGVEAAELDAMAAAWRLGGAAAVGALCRPWHPAPRLLEPGLAAMTEAHDGASRRMNRVVSHDGRTELALGRDGLWYLLRRERRSAPLVAAAPGSTDPRILLAPVEEAGPPLPAPAPPGDVPRLAGEQLRLL